MGFDPLRFLRYFFLVLFSFFLIMAARAQKNPENSGTDGSGAGNGGPETISETVPIPVLDKNGGIFGRAQRTGVTTGLIEGKGRGLSPESQSEILRAMFEGDQTGAGRE